MCIRDRGYDPDGKLFVNTHLIVGIEESGEERIFRTKGDNNNVEDDKLRTEDDILGKEIAALPTVGRFFAFIKQPIGLITCIAIPLVILLVFEIFNLIRLSKGSKKNKEFLDDAPHGSIFDEDALPVKARKRAGLFDENDSDYGDEYPINTAGEEGKSLTSYEKMCIRDRDYRLCLIVAKRMNASNALFNSCLLYTSRS